MASDNYKDRFIAEYWQNKIRLLKLQALCVKWDNGLLKFTPTCPREIFDRQIETMEEMCRILEERAVIEEVDLFRPQSSTGIINGFKAACESLAGFIYKLPPCRNNVFMAARITEASLWAKCELDKREAK